LERTVSLAQLLAERLLGAALSLEPALVADLARQALREARGARRVRIQACEADAVVLNELRAQLGFPEDAIEIELAPDLGQGSLILSSDVGRSDARIHVQLERLGAVLHDALQRG
jgi:flagellar biosynthesis/type III secretory pathway protein FliH